MADGQVNITAIEQCGDGVDNDCNGDVDCDDPGCITSPMCPDFSCVGADLGLAVGDGVYSGNNTNYTDNARGTCHGTGGREIALLWQAQFAGCYTFDTQASDYDTTLYVRTECNGTELGCNDDSSGLQSELDLTLSAGQRVVVFVDGYSSWSTGNYVLDINPC